MAPTRAKFYSYGTDDICADTKKYLEESGVALDVRDLEKEPMSEHELRLLIGNLDIVHFLNPLSDSYTKNKLDEEMPTRSKLIELMAKDYTLIRRPIIKANRLLMVGCDKKKITDMLQIGSNEEGPAVDGNRSGGGNRGGGRSRHHGSRGSRRSVASAKG